MDQEKENNSEIDLSKSFGDSGRKFQEEDQSPQYFFRPGTPKIIRWLIKYSGGLIKNENQAAYVLIGFVAVVIIITLVLIFGGENKGTLAPKPKGLIEEGYYPELYHEYFPNR